MAQRTDYWHEDLAKAVVMDWRDNMTTSQIAKKHGLTRNQVAGKIYRMRATRDDTSEIVVIRKKMGRPIGRKPVSWDERLTETWAQRKARRAKESISEGVPERLRTGWDEARRGGA